MYKISEKDNKKEVEEDGQAENEYLYCESMSQDNNTFEAFFDPTSDGIYESLDDCVEKTWNLNV